MLRALILLSQKLSPASCSPLDGAAHGSAPSFPQGAVASDKDLFKVSSCLPKCSGLISLPLGKGDGDTLWKHSTGKSYVGLLHCPVTHANIDQYWNQAVELSCGFLPI